MCPSCGFAALLDPDEQWFRCVFSLSIIVACACACVCVCVPQISLLSNQIHVHKTTLYISKHSALCPDLITKQTNTIKKTLSQVPRPEVQARDVPALPGGQAPGAEVRGGACPFVFVLHSVCGYVCVCAYVVDPRSHRPHVSNFNTTKNSCHTTTTSGGEEERHGPPAQGRGGHDRRAGTAGFISFVFMSI